MVSINKLAFPALTSESNSNSPAYLPWRPRSVEQLTTFRIFSFVFFLCSPCSGRPGTCFVSCFESVSFTLLRLSFSQAVLSSVGGSSEGRSQPENEHFGRAGGYDAAGFYSSNYFCWFYISSRSVYRSEHP